MTRRRWVWEQDRTDPVVKRQRGARYTVLVAIVLDVTAGFLFAHYERISVVHGLYWAEEEATTVGSGYLPVTGAGQLIKALVGVTIIPLFAATFSIFTTALTATHVHKVERDIKKRVEEADESIRTHFEHRLRRHLGPAEDDDE